MTLPTVAAFFEVGAPDSAAAASVRCGGNPHPARARSLSAPVLHTSTAPPARRSQQPPRSACIDTSQNT